jgi:hypothetical protein
MTRAEAELVRARELTNGRYSVPIPFEYIEDMTDVPVRVRKANRDAQPRKRTRIRMGDWR